MELMNMTWKEIEKLPKDTVFFITLSPLEAHGPHLPVATDFLIAKEIEEKAIEKLNKEGINAVSLLSLPIGVCHYLKDFPGTISISSKTLSNLLSDIFQSMIDFGYKNFIVCNFHMDLEHLKGIHSAIKKFKNKANICEPLSAYYYRGELFEKLEGEVHADKKETSLALFLFPKLVKNYDIEACKIKINLLNAFKSFKEIGATMAYIGSPAEANVEYGKKLFDLMVEKIVEASKMLKEGKCIDLPLKIKLILKI
ncbi:MAG: hypothetical protein DRN11_02855 [Thermoplasmata archaeon]|nr:MAG: hypothetical protein DRN11_02855 [Thermoplasmata archaeon]